MQIRSHYKPSYQSRTAHLSPGDALILYTDGLIEIDPRKPDRFSREQLLVQFITGLKADITAQEICDEISDAYHALREDQETTDDNNWLLRQVMPMHNPIVRT